MPRRRSRSCPRATASSLRSRSFSSFILRSASRGARTTVSCDVVVMRWRSGRAGRPVAGCLLASSRGLAGSAAWASSWRKVRETPPGAATPVTVTAPPSRSRGLQGGLGALEAVQAALVCGLGQVGRVVSPHLLPPSSWSAPEGTPAGCRSARPVGPSRGARRRRATPSPTEACRTTTASAPGARRPPGHEVVDSATLRATHGMSHTPPRTPAASSREVGLRVSERSGRSLFS